MTDPVAANAKTSPSGSPSPQHGDELPSFAALTTDEDRERKAERAVPGTFGVVVTPESFADLPEYAVATSTNARRGSVQTQLSTPGSPKPDPYRVFSRSDPNVVVLQRFEDASPTSSNSFPVFPSSNQSSLPEDMQRLELSTSPASVYAVAPQRSPDFIRSPDERLIRHYRQTVSKVLYCHTKPSPEPDGSIVDRDVFDEEASRFPPVSLHQALRRSMTALHSQWADIVLATPCDLRNQCAQLDHQRTSTS